MLPGISYFNAVPKVTIPKTKTDFCPISATHLHSVHLLIYCVMLQIVV